MKFPRMLPLVLLSLQCHAVFAQEPILMRRTFVNDSVERFKVTSENKISLQADGEDFKSSSNLTNDRLFRFSKVDEKGNATFEFEDSYFKGTQEVDGEESKIDDPESYESAYTAKVNPFMALTDVEEKAPKSSPSEEEDEDAVNSLLDSLDLGPIIYRLPETAVKPGDTWKFELPTRDFFKPGQFVLGKFRGKETWNEQEALVIEYKTNADAKADLSKLSGSGEDAEMLKNADLVGDLDDKTVLYLDPKDFSILGTIQIQTAHVHLKADQFEMTYEIKWTENSVRVPK